MQRLDREIHGDAELVAVLLPFLQRAQRRVEHPERERLDQPGLLGAVNELIGPYRAVLRVLPADQRLDTGELGGPGIDLGLELEHQLVVLDGAPQLAGQGELAHAVGVRFRTVHDEPELIALGRVHGHVGVLQELARSRRRARGRAPRRC